MSVFKCPSDCEHDYMFQHSIITQSRIINVDGVDMRETSTFITCRDCGHWLDGGRDCPHWCHAERGTVIVLTALDAVDCP